jgi:hypothetical protein
MQVLENDLAFLQASAPVLEEYLLSDLLYYPVTGLRGRQLSGDTTRLTLGNLLLSKKRLSSVTLPADTSAQFSDLTRQIDQVQGQWRSRWDVKIQQEIPNRLMLWKNYLSEWGEGSKSRSGDYPYNVRLRVILELLLKETDALLVQEKALLHSLDQRLKGKGESGNFVWDETFTTGFPSEEFWYLYMQF